MVEVRLSLVDRPAIVHMYEIGDTVSFDRETQVQMFALYAHGYFYPMSTYIRSLLDYILSKQTVWYAIKTHTRNKIQIILISYIFTLLKRTHHRLS